MKILYWNVQNFTNGKYSNATLRKVIQDCITQAQYPDLIILVEICFRNAADGGSGKVLSNLPGTQGLLQLYRWLKRKNRNYVCIPPVTVGAGGACEAVGCLYLSNRLTFQGPHIWTNMGPVPNEYVDVPLQAVQWPWTGLLWYGVHSGRVDADNPRFIAEDYPDPWDDPAFVASADDGTSYAPQAYYPNNNAPEVPLNLLNADNFYDGFFKFPYKYNRAPVNFSFITSDNKRINVFAVHTSPNSNKTNWETMQRYYSPSATKAIGTFGNLPEIRQAGTANTKMVIGDFNVPMYRNGPNPAYQNLRTARYQASIIQTPTMFLVKGANPQIYTNTSIPAIDNVLYRFSGGDGMAPTTLVVDQVQGNGVAGYRWTSQLQTRYNTLLARYNRPSTKGNSVTQFRGWNNFGHIAHRQGHEAANGMNGASDHMPVFIDFPSL
ncbi:hypothetical protein [Azospirillum soli]|uniref:hypothetical protein n=1 Tax=Azospirillum soli TaxID=1304799 RepID=UPI001AE9C1E6|nr:hypothetical protein [Azospirillum soli]MBP2312924.1 hypothetical protein [Azospirillum soli]